MKQDEAVAEAEASRVSYLGQLKSFSRNAWLLVAAKFFAYITFGIFEVLFNLYLVRLGFREDYIGAFQSVNVMGLALFSVPAGMIGDRVGHRKAVLAGSLLMVLTYATEALLVHSSGLLVLSFLNGAAFSMAVVPAMPLWAEGTSSTHLFAVSTTASSLGEMLGNTLGGILPGVFAAAALGLTAGAVGPDRSAMFVGVFFGLVGLIPFAYMARRSRGPALSHEPPREEHFWVGREARTAIIMFSIVGSLGGIGGGMFVPFFNVYMSTELGASTDLVGYVFSVAAVGAVVGSFVGAPLVSRWGKVVPVAVVRMMIVPFMLVLLFAPHPGVAAVTYFMRFTMMSTSWPLEWAFFMGALSPRVRGTASGIRTGAWNGGWAVASFLTGQILVRWGYPPVFILASVFTAANALVYLVYFGPQVRQQPASRRASESRTSS